MNKTDWKDERRAVEGYIIGRHDNEELFLADFKIIGLNLSINWTSNKHSALILSRLRDAHIFMDALSISHNNTIYFRIDNVVFRKADEDTVTIKSGDEHPPETDSTKLGSIRGMAAGALGGMSSEEYVDMVRNGDRPLLNEDATTTAPSLGKPETEAPYKPDPADFDQMSPACFAKSLLREFDVHKRANPVVIIEQIKAMGDELSDLRSLVYRMNKFVEVFDDCNQRLDAVFPDRLWEARKAIDYSSNRDDMVNLFNRSFVGDLDDLRKANKELAKRLEDANRGAERNAIINKSFAEQLSAMREKVAGLQNTNRELLYRLQLKQSLVGKPEEDAQMRKLLEKAWEELK